MEQKYWLGRKRASLARAEQATTNEARLTHLDVAGHCNVMALAVANQKRRRANVAAIV